MLKLTCKLTRSLWVLTVSCSSVLGLAGSRVDQKLESDYQALVARMPLASQAARIVDRHGKRFKLKSVNWYGPHVAGEVVEGLDKQPMDRIIGLIKEWGFNSVRLPFSNEMLHRAEPVAIERITANPDLMGKTPLEIFDITVRRLTDAGILVILNNHTSRSEWCCNFDQNGLWYLSGGGGFQLSSAEWEQDWLMLVERYRDNPLVVGADLRNEVRTMRWRNSLIPVSPNWGSRDRNDWHLAAETLGKKILDQHPHLLVIVEGINWWGLIPALGSGERPHLKPVRQRPIHLQHPHRLVYATHNYSFTGPRHNGDDGTSNGNPRYADLGREELYRVIEDEWNFVRQLETYYTAPVWVSEFGVARVENDERARQWFIDFIDYLLAEDLDFAYWPLNHESYGLVNEDWSAITDDDWRYPYLKALFASTGRDDVDAEALAFSNLIIRNGDDQQHAGLQDWLPGAHKGSCPIGYRLQGLSQDEKGLCLRDPEVTWSQRPRDYQVVAVDEWQSGELAADWAPGLTKYECPPDFVAIGFSRHYWGSSGLLCAPMTTSPSQQCETLWFDRGDGRASLKGGDWAAGAYKGQCADQKYLAGFAHRDGEARALLCCSFQ